jgi:predicted GNAT family acetyltransferase
MRTQYKEYEIDDDLGRVDFECTHAWLRTTYWSPGIDLESVEKAAKNSTIVIGVYHGQTQVGYARVLSDTVRFTYVADVFVDEAYRCKGIAQAIIRFVQDHPLLSEAPHVLLKTLDAHELYARVGFEPIRDPESWMRWSRRPLDG